jgi:hypothetical protein
MIKIHTKSAKAKQALAKSMCYGKIKHKSMLAAQYTLDQMNGKDSHLLEIYPCPFCQGFHIGHNRKKENLSLEV